MYLFIQKYLLRYKNKKGVRIMNGKKKEQETHDDSASMQGDCELFDSVEDVWFWFITAQQAKNDGARYVSGAGVVCRPCEPVDILKIMDSLYRKRRLLRDHLLVLRHYGRRHLAPDPRRVKEKRAAHLWREAFDRMRPVLEGKGIITKKSWVNDYMNDCDHKAFQSQFSLFEDGVSQ